MISIKIKGADEMKKAFARSPQIYDKVFKSKMDKIEKKVTLKSKQNAPIDKGHLRARTLGSSSSKEVIIRSKMEYAVFVHEGTKPSTGRYVPQIGKRIKTGRHPGQKANPFIVNAVKDEENTINKIIDDGIKEFTEELSR